MIVESGEGSSEVQQSIQPDMNVEEKPVINPIETPIDFESIPDHAADPSESVTNSSVVNSIYPAFNPQPTASPQPIATFQCANPQPTASPQSIVIPECGCANPQPVASPQQRNILGNNNQPMTAVAISSAIHYELENAYACEQAMERVSDQGIREQSSCCKKKKKLPKS